MNTNTESSSTENNDLQRQGGAGGGGNAFVLDGDKATPIPQNLANRDVIEWPQNGNGDQYVRAELANGTPLFVKESAVRSIPGGIGSSRAGGYGESRR